MSPQAYAQQLAALLPVGSLWASLRASSLFQGLLLGLAEGLARFHAAVEAFVREADPRTSSELLPDWESTTGLPDGCVPGGGSTEQRRAAVVARLVATGGASEAYFIGLAAAYGYEISLSYPALHTWRAETATDVAVVNMSCNGDCNDPLQSYGNEQLECLLNRAKPAHTVLEIAYGV